MNESLRDRIAAAIENALPREHTGYGTSENAAQAVIDALRTDEAVEQMAEAIYRSHDSYTHFTAKPWAEMVKGKDRANKFRVKQDRKAARAAINALLREES